MTYLLVLCGLVIFQVQMADSDFDARVAQPAYTKLHPKVQFDEAHRNFHTATGRYKPFADLISNDGYQVTSNLKPFGNRTLDGYNILVIANARGGETPDAAMGPAFTEPECDAVREWVRGGGSLLLIADHAPFGAAASLLASRFGVDMRSAYTSDSVYHDPESDNPTFLVFSRENGLLREHPITEGRNSSEKINLVITFTGQSLKGPEGSAELLKLSDAAVDLPPATPDQMREAIGKATAEAANNPGASGAIKIKMPVAENKLSAAGRAQGLAFTFGKGRVVVLGEAAFFSAQVVKIPNEKEMRFGMNRPGTDDRQFALNTMHWLSRLL